MSAALASLPSETSRAFAHNDNAAARLIAQKRVSTKGSVKALELSYVYVARVNVTALGIFYAIACQATDNAVTESVFHLLKTERLRGKTYKTRFEARQDVFDYIELFYNPKRRHANNGMLSPVEFEMAAK